MKHILLLEDHGGVRSVLSRLLEEEKYYITSTGLVAVACELLERVKFDLFIADVVLPDGTAFAALDVAKLHKVPFFLMTGHKRNSKLMVNSIWRSRSNSPTS
jgi:DNA-binding NtrC family response regulator